MTADKHLEVKVKCCCDTCAHYPCDTCDDDPGDIDLTLSVCACWDPHPNLMDKSNPHNKSLGWYE